MKSFSTILLLITINLHAQVQSNQLDLETYTQIKIDNVLFSDIKETKGNIKKITELLGTPTSFLEDNKGVDYISHRFENGLKLMFDDINSENDQLELSYFNTQTITINNKVIKVGNNISLLGENIKKNLRKDNTYSIIFTYLNSDCCPIIIEYNQETNVITKIEYFVWT